MAHRRQTPRAIEVQEEPLQRAACDQVAVEARRIGCREDRVIAIEIFPAGLHCGNRWIRKERHRVSEEIRRWHKIGVKDGNELPRRLGQALLQRARLVAARCARWIRVMSTPACR